MIDCIPLAEIVSISTHNEIWNPVLRSSSNYNAVTPVNGGNERSQVPKSIFEIHTLPEGYNSGHTYYLQASSEEEFLEILAKLKQHVGAAVKKAKQITTGARIHMAIKYFFESFYFQFFVAVLIILVRHTGGREVTWRAGLTGRIGGPD